MLTLQQLHGIACNDRNSGMLPVDLFEKRLLSLVEAFEDQIVSGKDHQGRTALHMVAISISIIWEKYYWRFRIDKEIYNLNNLAKTIVKELITVGCSVNETDIYGRTPLHYANFVLKNSLISHGADASIKDNDGNSTLDELQQQASNESFGIAEVFRPRGRSDETYILRLMNNKQMEIEVQCVDSQVKAHGDREFCLQNRPRLLWETGEYYTFNHPLVKQITNEVTYLMSAIANEIERQDPRFAIRPEFVGSSNEGTQIGKPNEFDFCFVLTKISELCEVSQSPELPTGFVHLRRKTIKVDKTSDFDSFFGKDEILNTEKLNLQFTTILHNALVNIKSEHNLDCNLKLPERTNFDVIGPKKMSNIIMMKSLNFIPVYYISIDIVPCICVDGWWPDEAIANVSDEIKKFGCNLVFDRPQELYPWAPYSESCARISFSKAESDMIEQSCDDAREAYMIGKAMIALSNAPSKYALKNFLLYCIEALAPTSEKAYQLGFSVEEMETKFHEMDRYLWLKCLMKCHLEFVSQDFCPCYFLPNFSSSIADIPKHLKFNSLQWITYDFCQFPTLCKIAYYFYRSTSNVISESCCQLPAPDLLWERFDRNQLIAELCEIAYNMD